MDAALETYRKGAKSVTMIIRENEIGDNVKYWVRPDIINRIKEGSIPAFFNSEITQFVWAIDNLLPRAPTTYFNSSPTLMHYDMHLMFCLDHFQYEHQIRKQLQIEMVE